MISKVLVEEEGNKTKAAARLEDQPAHPLQQALPVRSARPTTVVALSFFDR